MQWKFENIKEEIERQLRLMPKWNTVLYFGVYSRLIDVVAYVLDKFALTCDILYNMGSWVRTNSLKALHIMARAFSYKAYRKSGAFGNVVISANPDFNPTYQYLGYTTTIPKWTRITTESEENNVYTTQVATYYNGQVGNLVVPVKEGEPKEYLYIAEGLKNEKVTIFSDSAENDVMDVFIVNENRQIINVVEVVDNLYMIRDMTKYYCTIENADDFESVIITFGDGVLNRQLMANQRVLVKYADTQGANGNIESLNVLNVFKETFLNSANRVQTLYVTNIDAVSDGNDYEDIESIRNNASNLFQAGYRCGTKRDYKNILEAFPFIYKANVWTIEDEGGSTLLYEQNKVFIAAITSTGDALSTSQRSQVVGNLNDNYKSPTEVLEFRSLSKIYVMFNINAQINNQTIDVMNQTLKDLLYDTYSTLNVDFKENIYSSNYIRLIDEISEITRHETTIKLMEYGLPPQWISEKIAVFYQSTTPENEILLLEDSVELWIKRKIAGEWEDPLQIAETVGTSLVGINGYTIGSSNIDYANGEISYVVTEIIADGGGVIYGKNNPSEEDDDGYILTVAYNTKDGNDFQTQNVRLPFRNQISDIDKDFIFTNLTI